MYQIFTSSNVRTINNIIPVYLVKMKIVIFFALIFSIYISTVFGRYHVAVSSSRCVNMWDEGCINGQLPGAGRDDDYIGGSFSPGKRCINVWDEGCTNGQLPGAGRDDDYVGGSFSPGKRCINVWDEGCTNGQLPGAGRDDDYVNGGFNPGKRCLNTLGGCNSGQLGGSKGILGGRRPQFGFFTNKHL